MEKKRWGLIFSGLCLALVFSVSSVAANNNCKQCQRCDRDGDFLIRDTGTCIKQCKPDSSEIDPNDGDAGNCSVGEVNCNCPVDDVNSISLFEVTLTGLVTSTPAPAHWEGSTSGGRTIHLPVFNNQDMALNLSFFAALFPDENAGANCFPGDDFPDDPDNAGLTRLFAASIQSKNVKGMDDPQAIGMFWFNGKTNDELIDIDVGYVLQVLGTFSDPNHWPELFGLSNNDPVSVDTNTLTMTDWKMQVESTKKGGRKIACNSEGNFSQNGVDDVMISVKQTQ